MQRLSKNRNWQNLLLCLLFAVGTPISQLQASPKTRRWWNDATFYEIFVRSFQDSNSDGIGDLNGITSRLDYLNNSEVGTTRAPKKIPTSLGVRAIWLTPIFPSPSYHGYDVTDYQSINPDFGTMDDFHSLIREAHRRGIKVILDIAVNHTSAQHPWFKEALSSPISAHRDWYVWRPTRPDWGHWYRAGNAYYYSAFDRSMPNLNWRNPAVLTAVTNILRFWAQQGVDGFRLDAARYYVPGLHGEPDTPETHQAIANFASTIRSEFPDVVFVGEIWTDSETINSYCEPDDELDLAFNFPLAFSIVPSLNPEDPEALVDALQQYKTTFAKPLCSVPFLTNHDIDRVASQLYNYAPKIALAAAIYFMLPGTPVIYYGEELGFPNGPGDGDYPRRLPMQWDDVPGYGFTSDHTEPWVPFLGQGDEYSVAAQATQSSSFLALYKRLIHFRDSYPVMSRGDIDNIQYQADQGIVLWRRHLGDQNALVAINISYLPSRAVALDPVRWPFSRISETIYGEQDSVTGQGRQLSRGEALILPPLPPHSAQVFLIE